MRKSVSLSRCIVATVALIAFCLPCLAQQRNLRTILIIKLKLDQQDNWKATVKDYVATVKKAGSEQPFTVWESQTGPAEYAVVWYSAKWKDIGEEDPKLKSAAAEMTGLFARLNGQTESLDTWIDEMQPDLMIASKEVPTFVRTGRSRVIPGKMEEVKALFRDQVVPAIKKSGATSYGFAVARFGTPTNEYHTYLGISGWSDFDAPIGAEKGMSPEQWKAFEAKLPTLVESTEFTVWKYQPDLSYVPAAK